MNLVAAYFVISVILALASIHVVDAASLRASSDFVPGKQADGFIKEEQDIRRLQDPAAPPEITLVDWPPPYLVAYRRAFRAERVERCTAFLENRGIIDPPHEGTKCHKRQKGDYQCLIGIQTCSDGEEHPQKICSCDTTTGMLTCDYWYPCDGEADSQTWEQEKAPETFTFEPPEYWREYRLDPALEAYNFQPCGFLVLRNIDNPEDGDKCHARKDGDYTCAIGEQERECPDLNPPISIHPKRICTCDVASKRLTCSDWTAPPCPELEAVVDVPVPPAEEPEPPVEESGSNVEPATCPESLDMLDCALPGTDGLLCEFGRKVCQTTCEGDMADQGPLEVCGCEGGQQLCQPQTSCGLLSCPEVVEVAPEPVEDEWARCQSFQSCTDCLTEGCGFYGSSSCIPNCGFIADIACYEGDAVEQCTAKANAEEDAQACSDAAADCDVCTNTIQPHSGRSCLWLDFGGGSTPGCASFCGMLGCGLTGGGCPAPATCPDSEENLDCALPGTEGLMCDFGQKMCPDCSGVEQPSGPLMQCGCENGNPVCSATGCPQFVCPPTEPASCPESEEDLDCSLPENDGLMCDFGQKMCSDCSGVDQPSGPLMRCGCSNGEQLCAATGCPLFVCPPTEPGSCPESEGDLDCSLPENDGLQCEFGQKICQGCDGVDHPSGPLMNCGCENGNLECWATGCALVVCEPPQTQP